MKEQELYQRALDLWGRFAQEDCLFEEMRELELALILHLFKGTSRLEFSILKIRRAKTYKDAHERIEAVAEEIADVEIMLDEIKVLYHIGANVKVIKNLN